MSFSSQRDLVVTASSDEVPYHIGFKYPPEPVVACKQCLCRLWCKLQIRDELTCGCPVSSGSQDSCPDFGRIFRLSRRSTQVKLAFANTTHKLAATNCDGSGNEAFQAQHGAQPRVHVSMVLLDQVIQIF
jgi:hypothetical protein